MRAASSNFLEKPCGPSTPSQNLAMSTQYTYQLCGPSDQGENMVAVKLPADMKMFYISLKNITDFFLLLCKNNLHSQIYCMNLV